MGALLAWPVVVALRMAHDDPASAVLVLLIAPIGLLALGRGRAAGAASAVAALCLVLTWNAVEDAGLDALGYATYAVAFLTAAVLGGLGRAACSAGVEAPRRDGAHLGRAARSSSRISQELSAREREVLRLLALGYTNKEVGLGLYISDRTVESHRAHIRNKLGRASRRELVSFALEQGLIDVDRPAERDGSPALDGSG